MKNSVFHKKPKWRGELPKKKGLGQFADLMEGLARERVQGF